MISVVTGVCGRHRKEVKKWPFSCRLYGTGAILSALSVAVGRQVAKFPPFENREGWGSPLLNTFQMEGWASHPGREYNRDPPTF
jgi:hypothetical protein